jgi:hypothetical protein
MATLEERVQALEQENAARKKTEELLTIAVHALISKEAFEKLQDTVEQSQEQNGKLFDVLNNHNVLTNERLGDIQSQIVELDGKVVGLQTEMRQRFSEQDNKVTELDGKVVGLQTEMRQRFSEQDNKVTELDGKVVGLQTEMRQRFSEQDNKVTELDGKVVGLQTETRQHFTAIETQLTEHKTLLTEILARLPEKP